jgi:rsbT antagonist protein RsbS
MNRIPILKIKDTLIVSLQDDLTDRTAINFQDELLKKIYDTKAKGVLIDISVLDIVDSFLGRILSDTAKMIKLLGAELVICGMSSSVVITLVELGLEINNVQTALNIDLGLEKLAALVKSNQIEEVDYDDLMEEEKNDSV